MKKHEGFSLETVQRAKFWSSEPRFSDKFSDDEIDQALRRASIKVGKFVMPKRKEG